MTPDPFLKSHSPRRSSPKWRWQWHVVGLLLAVGTASGALASDKPVTTLLPEPFAVEEKVAYEPTLIDPPALLAAAGAQDAPVIVDVRSPEMYEMGHLSGAINVPGYQMQEHLGKVPLGVRLALYCS